MADILEIRQGKTKMKQLDYWVEDTYQLDGSMIFYTLFIDETGTLFLFENKFIPTVE